MNALVTGASSGIGRDMARYLVKLGYKVFAIGRNKEKLSNLKGWSCPTIGSPAPKV